MHSRAIAGARPSRGRAATLTITLLVAGLILCLPSTVPAQEARADSLERRVEELEARVDSLMRALREGDAVPADTADAVDELEELRAAARAAGEADEEGRREDEDEPQGSRTRSLQALNPEISVTGDIVGSFAAPAGEASDFAAVPREFEFSFQSALDPYTRTRIFVTRHEDFAVAGFPEHGHEEVEPGTGEPDAGEHEEEGHGFEIEEGYMYWVGLPGGFGARIGKFRQEIGLYNRWHTHALLEVDRPLASAVFLGEDGLVQTGAGVTLPSFTMGPATQTVTFETTTGSNEALFEGGGDLAYLGRLQSFWELSPSSYFQLGATGVYGENDEESLVSKLLAVDVSYRWTPARQSFSRDLSLKGQWYLADRREAGISSTGQGGFVQANYRANRRLVLGTRFDYLEAPGEDEELIQLAPSVSWWQSEWVRLRLQYNYLRERAGPDNHTVLLQTVWAVGPHKHETY